MGSGEDAVGTLLMSWNVRYFGHGSGGLRGSDRWTQRIAWALSSQPQIPDVIALQEVETTSLRSGGGAPQLDRFVDHLHRSLEANKRPQRFRAAYFPADRYGPKRRALMTTGLAVLVAEDHTVEAIDAAEITFVRLRAFERVKQRRIAARLRIRPPSGPSFELVNTHLSLPAFLEVGAPGRRSVPRRMGYGSNQLAEVDKLLAFVDPERRSPVVVAGDFNARPGSPAYERIVRAGLVDAHRAGDPTGHQGSGEIGTAAFMHLRMHLDHVFCTPSVRWRWLRPHSVDDGPFRGLSDHAPTLGRLDVADQAA